jgi:DNA-binding IclR family transcriptional regulator
LVVCVDRADNGTGAVRISYDRGSTMPLNAGASALMERLARIRRLGYSATRGELDPDVVGIAAPIKAPDGQVTAAVSVAALASRVYPEAEAEFAQKVRATASKISECLALSTD